MPPQFTPTSPSPSPPPAQVIPQQPTQRSNSQQLPQRVNDSMRNSQQLPLKQVAQPAFLSKQAIELKQSLEKLKQLSQRKQQSRPQSEYKQQQDIPPEEKWQSEKKKEQDKPQEEEKKSEEKRDTQRPSHNPRDSQRNKHSAELIMIVEEGSNSAQGIDNLERRDTFGHKDKDRPPGKTPNFGIMPVSQELKFFTTESQLSPIQRQPTQQSDQEFQRVYQYQETNESHNSNDINIYSGEHKQVLGQIELVATASTVKQDFQIPKSDNQSNASLKTYSKMTPEEAESAYQNRRNQIKHQLQKTKSQFRQPKPKIEVMKKTPVKKKQQQQPAVRASNQHTTYTTNTQSKVSPISKKQKTQGDEERKDSGLTNNTNSMAHSQIQHAPATIATSLVFNERKQLLLQEINNIDKEIKDIEQQLTSDNLGMSKSTSSNHRAEMLYQQGKMKEEQRRLLALQSKSKKKEEELKECTFKPSLTSKSASKSGSTMARTKKFSSAQKSNYTPQDQSRSDFFSMMKSNDSLASPTNSNLFSYAERVNEKFQHILSQASQIRNQLGLS